MTTLCQEDEKNGIPPEQRRVCPFGKDVLDQWTAELQALHSAVETQTRIALSGYPLGADGKPDTAGHRNYHEALISQAKAKTEFWRKMTFELTKSGLLVFLVWVLYELWLAFLQGPRPPGIK